MHSTSLRVLIVENTVLAVRAKVHAAIAAVPVVVVTGRGPSEVRRELDPEDANGYVSKDHLGDLPLTIRALLQSV